MSDTQWIVDAMTKTSIDEVFNRFTNATPGCAMAIYQGDDIEYANGYGMSNLEHGVPITPSSKFHVASISKQFTAMCIALLDQEGSLDIDDPVQTYLSELPAYEHPVTVRHLLHHVSGLRDQWTLLRLAEWREEDLVTEADCFDLITRQQEANFVPNDMYMYSNTGYTLLAMIVKAVTGKSLRTFANDRIFIPLGMTNTHFQDDHSEIVPGRTQAYQPRGESGYRVSIPTFDVVGTTSLFTTVEDFARWNANFGSGVVGGHSLLSAIQTVGTFNNDTLREYGWGLEVKPWRGHHRVGHDGADHGYRACSFHLPALDFGITVFSNLSTSLPRELAESVASIVLGERLEASPPAEFDEPIAVSSAQLAGIYTGPTDNGLPTHLIITNADDVAQIHLSDTSDSLKAEVDGTFSLHQSFLTSRATATDEHGNASTIQLRMGKGEISTFTKVEQSTYAKYSLETFTGDYHCPELDISVSLVLAGDMGNLLWNQRKISGRLCARLDNTTFGSSSLGSSTRLEFELSDAGDVTGFKLSAGRVRNLQFVRQ